MDQAHEDGIDTQTLGIVSVVSAVVLVALIVGLQVLYYRLDKAEHQIKVVQQQNTQKMDVLSRQRAEIAGFRWVDKAAQRVAIPIERAMELVVKNPSLLAGRKGATSAGRDTVAGQPTSGQPTQPLQAADPGTVEGAER